MFAKKKKKNVIEEFINQQTISNNNDVLFLRRFIEDKVQKTCESIRMTQMLKKKKQKQK